MDLKRRLERLEKELKSFNQNEEEIFILVHEITQSERDEERMRRHEEELLERLKDYPNAKIIIAVVDPKGWQFRIPELGVEVNSKGEI
ncbi:hypothetical protein [Desulfurobacterium sp.]